MTGFLSKRLFVMLFAGASFFTAAAANALPIEKSPEDFRPNYMTVEDVALSTPDGNPAGQLNAGTLVTAKLILDGVLNVKTADGKAGLASADSFSRLRSSIQVTDACKAAAQSSNGFAIDLYQQARRREGNLFFSPASVSTALAMTHAGASGTTKQQMADVLHLTPEQDVDAGFAGLMDLLNSTGDRNGYQMSTANRLWGAEDARFESSFLALMKEHYHAPLESLDFGQTEAARNTINTWVLDQTHGRIVDLIPPGILKPDDRMALTNAIYFLGGWQSEFDKSLTKQSPFHLTTDESVETATMYQQESFAYAEDSETQIVSLPYRENSVSMVILLPKQRDGLTRLEDRFTPERLDGWLEKLNERPVQLHMPKFKLQSQLMLADVLRSMGMTTAFSDDADFSPMSKRESLKISEVIHQANVDVDEKGTEAAAATAVILAPTSAAFDPTEPPKPVVVRADHPFLFLIRDNATGAILFLGRVLSPTADAGLAE